MKKICVYLACIILALTASGCKSRQSSESVSTSVSDAVTTVQEPTENPDPLAPKTTSSTTTVTSASTSSSVSSTGSNASSAGAVTTIEPDPLGGGAFSFDSNGAIVFEKPEEKQDDSVMIAAAQKLFESACTTYWNYMINCPYDLDYNDYVENEYSWQFYKVTTSGIKSLADVERDYGKVFSRRYPNELSTNYREENGAVYAVNGERGAHLYYSASKITDIQSRSDDEIIFTVENFYDGSDFGDESYSETDTFSMVLEDGIWKAGRFTLPY